MYDRYQELQEKVSKLAKEYGPEFDALVILGSYPLENGATGTVMSCYGNWHAQNGMMQYILKKRLAEANIEAHRNEKPG